MRDVLNDHFAQLQARLRRVQESDIIEMDAPAVSDAPFIVPHKLGVVPKAISWIAQGLALVYYTNADRQEWNSRQVKLRANVSGVHVIIEVKA